MKKIQIFFTVMLFMFSSHAQTIVNAEVAKSAALHFAMTENLISVQNNPRTDTTTVQSVVVDEDTLLYLFPADQYYIIVSRFKCFPPILGYFDTSTQSGTLTESLRDNYFIQKYCYYAKHAKARRITQVLPQWESLFPMTSRNQNSLFIDVLLSTKWGQTTSNDTGNNIDYTAYNYYVTDSCSDCVDGHSPAGCMAVAMGQIMNYWKYPIIQYGKSYEHQFDWCNMADLLTQNNDNYNGERNAIARLLADCGAACNMNYCFMSRCCSFAWPIDAKNALVDTFGYSSDISLKRRILYTDEDWKQLIIDDLINGFPVLYSSISTPEDRSISGMGGHAFVCDGYKENANLFHFNLGWRGNSNGWYNIDNLIFINGADTSDFNNFERAIFHIHPPEDTYRDICNYPLSLYNHYHWYYDLNGQESPAEYKNVPTTSAFLFSVPANSNIPTSWHTIPQGASAEYVAHKQINLLPGFTVERGAEFVARIEPCPKCEQREIQSSIGPQNNPSEIISEEIGENNANQDQSISRKQSGPPPSTLYPNPTSKEITMETNGEITSVVIYNTLGQPVGGWQMRQLTSLRMTVDASILPPGTYILTVRKSDGSTLHRRFSKR